VLGLAPGADAPALGRRFRALARLLHPDKLAARGALPEARVAQAAEAFKAVARAHALLVKGEW